MLSTLAFLFVLSGAAGLVYESVWARYLGLFVGHTAYAQLIVLVIFLGGMAVGSWLVGKVTERLRDPLLTYAIVEGAIGVLGLVFHPIYITATDWAYHAVFPHLPGSALAPLVKWGLAGFLILPQSILLGATFPLMSAGALRRIRGEPGRVLAFLYFANSFGAAIGVLVAGFYLVGVAGLPGTVLAAAIMNLLVALAAVVVRWRSPTRAQDNSPAGAAAEPSMLSTHFAHRLLLWVSFGTAMSSFIYEIAWIRMLSLVLSSASHAFDLMLSAFILGLALGSFWVRSRADRFRDPVRALGVVQCAMGFLALATLPLYVASFGWTVSLFKMFAQSELGYVGFSVSRYGICLAVMLPATFCAGITLPLITRILVAGGIGERAISQVYSANTVGSIVGAALAALVLMPLLGLKGLLASGACLDMGIGVLLLVLLMGQSPGARRLGLAATAALTVVLAVFALSPAFDKRLLISGIFRHGSIPEPDSRELLFYKDGRTATVSAERSIPDDTILISTNGKSDGGLFRYWLETCTPRTERRPLLNDSATVTLAAILTLAHRPDAKLGAVIGQGTGLTTHLLLASPKLEHLYTVEIEPEMLRASRAFYPANRRSFDDPRSHFVIDDAKSYFAAAGDRYDFVFSEPSNPWVSGIAGLFTTEFYQRISQYLAPEGVFAQWIHTYDIDDELIMTVLAALHSSFQHYEVFQAAQRDLVIVATHAAAAPQADWNILRLPDLDADLCHHIPLTAEAMESTRVGNEVSLGPLIGRFQHVNSDFFPYLDDGAEKARYLGRLADGVVSINDYRYDLTAPFRKLRTGPASFTAAPVPGIRRMYDSALGATLRKWRGQSNDPSPGDLRTAGALSQQRLWDAEIANGQPPADWRLWLQRMNEREHDLYGGTRGYVDEKFYRSIDGFLDRAQAPAEVRAAVDFRHGMHGWDFPQAVRSAPPLVAAAVAHRSWVSPDELREGTTVAQLMTGDVAGAQQTLAVLEPLSTMPPTQFRNALLRSYVEMAATRAHPAP